MEESHRFEKVVCYACWDFGWQVPRDRETEREGERERTLRSHELPSPQDYVGEVELKTMTGQLRAG